VSSPDALQSPVRRGVHPDVSHLTAALAALHLLTQELGINGTRLQAFHRQPHDLFLVKAGQGPYQRWTSSPKLDAVFGHKSPVRFKHFRTPPSFVNPCLVDPNKIQLIKLANQHVPGL